MSVVTATITSNGKVIDPEFGLLYIDIMYEYNKIPSAELSYIDGDFAKQEFKLSDGALFVPGSEIEIKLRYEDESSSEKTVFKGIVLKQGLQTNTEGCALVAEICDKAVKMTFGRNSAIIENKKDSDVISALLSEKGLASGTIEATDVQHKKIVQYYVTDWDFMLSRAEINGLFISVEGGKVSAKKPSLSAEPVLDIKFGIDEIYDFEMEADARNQFASVESRGWDVKSQQLTAGKTAKEFGLKQGNLQAKTFANALDAKNDLLISAISMDEKEAQAWADATMVRSRLSMLKGRVKVIGTAKVKLGDLIKLEGMGKRFSGVTLVTGLRHQVNQNGWTTDIQFGVDPEGFLAKNTNVVSPKAAGLLPGVNGLQVGVVTQIKEDPDKEDRVEVTIPAMTSENGKIWARIVSIYAGKDMGVVFWPEVGDEVIVGFLNDDPRQPVILGAVHSSKNPSPIKSADKNPVKGIITKHGLKMLFNDEEKKIIISTSDNSLITINEKEKLIEVEDANKNTIKLSDQGISMESDKNIVIKSGANVKIQGKAVEIKGNKVDVI